MQAIKCTTKDVSGMKMVKCAKACLMSMTMFCAFPMPFYKWDDDARPLMTACLPIVGLEIGSVWALLTLVIHKLIQIGCLPLTLAAVIFAAYPYVASGFMHLDGFMDVTDAVKSCRDLQERRRILKDSNVGAFAVIAVVMVLLFNFAASLSLDFTNESILILIFLPVVSRCMSAIAVTTLPPMDTSQFSGKYREGISKGQIAFLIFALILDFTLAVILCGAYAVVLPAAMLGYVCALTKAYRNLKGMNGDIAGYSLTIAELTGVIAYALVNPVMAII